MVWSSASSTLIGVVCVLRISANAPPLRPVASSARLVYRVDLSGPMEVSGRELLRSSLPQGCSSQIHCRSLWYRQGRSSPRAPPAPFPGCSLVPLDLPLLNTLIHRSAWKGYSPKSAPLELVCGWHSSRGQLW